MKSPSSPTQKKGSEPKTRKEVVKAYGLIKPDQAMKENWLFTFPIYLNANEAGHTLRVFRLKEWRVIPCEISFSLPATPRKKTKKV